MFASRAQVGIFGIGDVVPQGPVQTDITAYYQAGLIVGAGGTSPLDMSNSTADEQAAFNSGFNAGSSPITLAQTQGGVAPGSGGTPPPTPPGTPVISNTIVFGIAGIAMLFFIVALTKR